ncbi:MBL fold metallo-hydrolase [Lentzea albida]|uniref:Glyoxylase, beta-lactamase superfamily II n=1 Tax=Lentzea albida TaxID=65499 RepID=A0A1H9WE06_9PSEU|nr:MBL fold metallo-hydrolase [Lentzea albida]SES32148.1 Glyoxylase, beta-lactamase superfamily II [Lentzea albida]
MDDKLTLGDVEITRIVEYAGSVRMSPAEFFPDKGGYDSEDLLVPDFYDPATNECRAAVQTWLLRSGGRTVLVDTGVGNHKERPYAPVWSRLDTGFLDDLARAGVRPEDVDVVVNTHLHIDHVGWNTRLDGREWVPTFPNATYLMPRRDFEFWNPANEHTSVFGRGNQNVFEDSVAPVVEAGLVELWDDSHRIDGDLRLELAAGHTPGSSVVVLESRDDKALFVGDLVHSPLQVLHPDVNSCFCEDPVQARATRRRLFGRAEDERALVFPAHFGGHGAVQVKRAGTGFEVQGWAGFSRV